MAQRLEAPGAGQFPIGPARMKTAAPLAEPLSRIEDMRARAAFSPSADERRDALSRLHDMDSLSFVAERSPYHETRESALGSLKKRISSFTPEVVAHLREASASQSVRSCAAELLA